MRLLDTLKRNYENIDYHDNLIEGESLKKHIDFRNDILTYLNVLSENFNEDVFDIGPTSNIENNIENICVTRDYLVFASTYDEFSKIRDNLYKMRKKIDNNIPLDNIAIYSKIPIKFQDINEVAAVDLKVSYVSQYILSKINWWHINRRIEVISGNTFIYSNVGIRMKNNNTPILLIVFENSDNSFDIIRNYLKYANLNYNKYDDIEDLYTNENFIEHLLETK